MRAPLECGQPDGGVPHSLRLPDGDASASRSAEAVLRDAALQGRLPPPGPLRLVTGARELKAAELGHIAAALEQAGLELVSVASSSGRTRVAAAGLGLAWETQHTFGAAAPPPREPPPLTIHQGTLRSGDHLEVQGSVLVLGDVNPGARITASGHVLVWGQLRGVAHAGCNGDQQACIVALQLRPVQLRIADLVARGPAEPPPMGLAEQAVIIEGAIAIQPAQPQWPLTQVERKAN